MKEENILYPMCDQRLNSQREALAAAIGRELSTAQQHSTPA
jgi:hypothetical protein